MTEPVIAKKAVNPMRISRKSMRSLLLSLAIAGTVAGCSVFESDKYRAPCPNFLILGLGDNLVKFIPGPGRDVTDIKFEAKIVDFAGSCEHDPKGVSVTLNIAFAVKRGPANRERRADLSYFVAIPKFFPAKEGKRVFPIAVGFKKNQSRVIYRDEIEMRIPLKPKEVGANYDVYLGFELSEAELDYNRSRTRRN
ncbi:MAG: hypothetical protein HQ514_01575 [Rhodospirillales bacterium]|nr:hypothetical protein [Rhodospirillales bacterium]